MPENKTTNEEVLKRQKDDSVILKEASRINSPLITDTLFSLDNKSNNTNDYKFKGAIPLEYQVLEEKKLANALVEAAKIYNQLIASRMSQVETMNQQHGNELNLPTTAGTVVEPGAPAQDNQKLADNNYKKGRTPPAGVKPIIVLHETVGGFSSVVSIFNNPSAEVSYHTVVQRNGTISYFVPPTDTAYGSAPAKFEGQTKVNSFAYHISLESPPDRDTKRGQDPNHKGYTEEQYKSLAWLVARTGIPNERITTHEKVNTDGTRFDPYKFDFTKFNTYLAKYPREKKISFGVNGE